MKENQYIVVVDESFIRNMEVYNLPDPSPIYESGWEAAVLPGYLGVYSGRNSKEAIELACGDHGIIAETMKAIPLNEL